MITPIDYDASNLRLEVVFRGIAGEPAHATARELGVSTRWVRQVRRENRALRSLVILRWEQQRRLRRRAIKATS